MLKVKELTFQYKNKKKILNNISFELEKGEFVALAGPNGSGKTTLIKILCDLLKIQKGEIQFNGKDHNERTVRQEIVYLPSEDYLPEFLTGREYIRLFCNLYHKNIDNEKLNRLAHYYSMKIDLENLIEDYSHGMRKKIQILSALMVQPKLLIIDETLNGIDIEAKEVTKHLINDYVNRDGTVLLCTHDLHLVEEISERVILIYNGQIHLDEETKDLHEKYNKKLTEIFKEAIHYEEKRYEV